MKRMLTSSTMFLAFGLVLTAAPRPDVTRTVYFSAVDGSGAQVTDLTAADLAVKEGGKDRQIVAVKPATAPMTVFLLVEDAGSGWFQAGVAQFIQATFGRAVFAISVLNPQPVKVADFTMDGDTLRAAIGRMGQRGKIPADAEQIIAAVSDAAKELQKRKAARASIIVLTVVGEKALADQADEAINALKASGASLNVVYLTGLDLGKVLGDGPKQSGGVIQQVNGNATVAPILAKLADTLLHQYVLTYNLPEGVKPNEKLSLTTSRKGVTLLAPSRIPDK
jgi:hypothetical protein